MPTGRVFLALGEKFPYKFAVREHALAGEIEAAREIQRQANNIIDELIRLEVMPAEKAALEMMGIEMGECLLPFPRLSNVQKEELRKVLVDNGCRLA